MIPPSTYPHLLAIHSDQAKRLRLDFAPRAFRMAQITLGCDAIPHPLLQYPKLWEAPFLAPVEEHLPFETHDEDSLPLAWDQRNLRKLGFEGREQLLRRPPRSEQPPAASAIFDFEAR